MMWGDIIAKNPEMIKQLPEDIQFIVWSYGGRDDFREMIEPFKNSGHTFWIAPGASCWATSFPYIDNYTKNIANFNRDAVKYGAKGVMGRLRRNDVQLDMACYDMVRRDKLERIGKQ